MVYAHKRFAEPMLDYIIQDFINSRIRFDDHTIGAMVVCDSADQARKLFEIFINKYNQTQKTLEPVENYTIIAEPEAVFNSYKASLTSALILHDVGNKKQRKQAVEDFKDGNIDILFVYNMLLTGFDAKRLKKLYIGRIIKDHTRVNRPYKNFKYGYVVESQI